MTTSAFWLAALERAVRTFAQVLLGFLGAGAIGFADVPWVDAFSVGGLAALASVLTAVIASGVGPAGPGLTEAAEPARDADVRRVLHARGRG